MADQSNSLNEKFKAQLEAGLTAQSWSQNPRLKLPKFGGVKRIEFFMGYNNVSSGRQKINNFHNKVKSGERIAQHLKKSSNNIQQQQERNGAKSKNESFKSLSRGEEQQSDDKSPYALDKEEGDGSQKKGMHRQNKPSIDQAEVSINQYTIGDSPVNNTLNTGLTFDNQVLSSDMRTIAEQQYLNLQKDLIQVQINQDVVYDRSRYRQDTRSYLNIDNKIAQLDLKDQGNHHQVQRSGRKQKSQNPFQQDISNMNSKTTLQKMQITSTYNKSNGTQSNLQINKLPQYNKYNSSSKSKFVNDQQMMTQKASIQQLTLPFITKKNSITETESKDTILHQNGLITKSQQQKIVSNWSPFPQQSLKKIEVLALKGRPGCTYSPNLEKKSQGIKEREEIDEETQIQAVNDYINVQENFTSMAQQKDIQAFDDDSKSQKEEDKSFEYVNQLKSQFNSETKAIFNGNGRDKSIRTQVNNEQKKAIFQTYGENITLTMNEVSLSGPQSGKRESITVIKKSLPAKSNANLLKSSNIKLAPTINYGEEILNSHQQLQTIELKNKAAVKQQRQQTLQDKKQKQQQTREAEIRKFFQANVNAQVQYQNTEFSTPGASSKFLDEYHIEEKSLLGVGGYAEVRLATHKKTGHKVAIKIYEKYKLIDAQIKQNLVREIKILQRLNHPNIMRLYESIDTLSNVYLISEFIEGLPLNEYVKQHENQKLSEKDANYILKQLLSALSYLHSKSMCHRDIKLENIIIDPKTKFIKLIDFGFSVYSLKPLKLFCGTPSYMAPEIIAKKEYNGAPTDVWTCGVAFYVMLCGYFPFAAHTERELIRKIQQGIYHVPKDLSKDTIRVLQKMLHTDPSNRSASSEILNEGALKDLQIVYDADGGQQQQNQSNTQDKFQEHIDKRTNGNNTKSKMKSSPIRESVTTTDRLDEDTFQHMVKLGYAEEEIKKNFQNEEEIIGKLYKRLLILKGTKNDVSNKLN